MVELARGRAADPVQRAPAGSSRQASAASIESTGDRAGRAIALEVRNLTGGRRLLSDDHAFLDAIAALGRTPSRCHPHHPRAIRRARFVSRRWQARHRSGAARVAVADQPALPVQRADHDRLSDSDLSGRARSTRSMRLTALLRGVLRSEGEMTHARPGDRSDRIVSGDRARSVRGTAARAVRVPTRSAATAAAAAAAADRRKRVKHGIAPERRGGDLRGRSTPR